jgi:predicted enzyme related to lactoylglutathione lyase
MTDADRPKVFLKRARGFWAGSESVGGGPSRPARLESKVGMGGAALVTDAVHTAEDGSELRTHTVQWFGPNDEVHLVAASPSSPPQTFVGRRTGDVVRVERADASGEVHAITFDYGEDDVFSVRHTAGAPEDRRVLFEGRYGRRGGPIGRAVWMDLTVDRGAEVGEFYRDVIGWTARGTDMGGYEDLSMFDEHGGVVAGVCHARGPNADLPPAWLVYFAVDALDRAVATTKRRGGEVIAGPKSYGPSRYVVLRDPAGVPFVAFEEHVPGST